MVVEWVLSGYWKLVELAVDIAYESGRQNGAEFEEIRSRDSQGDRSINRDRWEPDQVGQVRAVEASARAVCVLASCSAMAADPW